MTVLTERLAKLVPMLGSPNQSEVLATVGAISRILKMANRDFNDLALMIREPRSPAFDGRLTEDDR